MSASAHATVFTLFDDLVRPGDLGDWSAWLPGAQAAGACAW
jgi:hypothetical protein